MPSREYGAARSELQDGEPIGFIVGGQEFILPRPLPGIALFDYFDLQVGKPTMYDRFQGAWKFLRRVVDPKDIDRLVATLERCQSDMVGIWNIAQGVLEDATGRPTPERDSSQGSRSSNGPPSKRGARRSGSSHSKPRRASA